MNTCAKCLTERPRSDFGADKRNSTGLQSICKQCYKDKRDAAKSVVVAKSKSGVKTCNRCSAEKTFSAFHRNRRSKDGYQGICITCTEAQKDSVKITCKCCGSRKLKTAYSTLGLEDQICTLCNNKSEKRKIEIKPQGSIETFAVVQSIMADNKHRKEVQSRSVRAIKRRGKIDSVKVVKISTIFKDGFYVADVGLVVDGNSIRGFSKAFKSKIGVNSYINKIYENPVKTAKQFLEAA